VNTAGTNTSGASTGRTNTGRTKTGRTHTMACRAVAQAGLVATTASLDDEQPWPLLLVAGWLTTAADLVLDAEAVAAALR
jgi:hypothetical protein